MIGMFAVESNIRTKSPSDAANVLGQADWLGVDMHDVTCSVSGCSNPRRKREWCQAHYQRWKRYGTPTEPRRRIANGDAPDACTIDGCSSPHHSKGYCSTHYSRWKQRGTPHAQVGTRGFWTHVEKSEGCWIWTGFVSTNGYGQTKSALGKGAAHRVAYEQLVGPIPDGLDLDHLCHNEDRGCPGGFACPHRRCVNPNHLEPVTRSTNMRRANARIERAEFCDQDGCPKKRHARGMCPMHYQRWRLGGRFGPDVAP